MSLLNRVLARQARFSIDVWTRVHRDGAATVLAGIREPALPERIPDQRHVPIAFSRTYDGMMCIQENGGIPKQA
jgi:hypothetical protein